MIENRAITSTSTTIQRLSRCERLRETMQRVAECCSMTTISQ